MDLLQLVLLQLIEIHLLLGLDLLNLLCHHVYLIRYQLSRRRPYQMLLGRVYLLFICKIMYLGQRAVARRVDLQRRLALVAT